MPLNPDQFRAAMGSLANGVTLVTVATPEGAMGMTATAVSSLSLDPPLLLVCIGHEASLHGAIVAAPSFGVVMLAEGQQPLADYFATRGRQAFEPATPRTPAGLPRPRGALAVIDCRRTAVLEGGDHSIVIGELLWADVADGRPLLHFRGRYTGLLT